MKHLPIVIFTVLIFSGTMSAQEEVEEVQITEDVLTAQDQYDFNTHFFEAMRYKALEDQPNAVRELKECLVIIPDHPVVNFELASYYLNDHMPGMARPYLEKAVKGDSENIWVRRAQWELAKQDFDFPGEEEALERLRQLEPGNPEFLWELAMVRLKQNKVQEAISDLDQLESMMGPSEVIMQQKINIYLETGDLQSVEKEITDAIARSPNDMALRGRLAEFYQNYADPRKAIGVYEEIVRRDPQEPRAHLHLAEFLFESGRIDSAKYHLRFAMASSRLGIDQKIAVMANLLRIVNSDRSYMPFALEMADSILKHHPGDPKAYALKADFTVRNGELEESRRLWNTAVQLPGGDKWLIWQQIMQMDLQLARWDSLDADSKRVRERYPNQPAGYLFGGLANTQLENYDEAILIMEEGILYAVGNPELEVQFYLQLATAYQADGDYYAAYENLDQVLNLVPDHPTALNNYAYYLSLQGERLNEALTMASKAVEGAPLQYTFWDTYAWVYFKMERYEDALIKIDKAMELGGASNPEVIEHKGDILFSIGRKEEARAAWESAIAAGGNAERIQKKLNVEQ